MDATFETAAEGLAETGGSVEERELVELLSKHGKTEGAILQQYQRFAQVGPSPAARYLVQQIIEDEHRHHRQLAEMANSIGWGWAGNSPVDAVPDLLPPQEPEEVFLQETAELLAHEEEDRAALRRLRKRFKPYEESTMWTLLLDVMLLDTEKHIQILTFLKRHSAPRVLKHKGADNAVLSPGAVAGDALDRRPTLP